MSTVTKKILISDELADEGLAILDEKADVTVKIGLSEDALCDIIGDFDALLVRSGTQVTSKVIEAGKNLKFIGRAGAGVDNIDMDAASKAGIVVANAPEGNTLAATEHTMAMILSLCRNIPQACASMRAGEWKRSKFMGIELNEKTLGIVGLGRIGREVARRAASFNMRIIGYDPFITKEKAAEMGIEGMSLEELFTQADIITVHTPLIKETQHIINAESIKTMKDDVCIINCARGGIIDEQALADAVASGKVGGAAIDVFEDEPPHADSPLLKQDKIITTPHLGASTVEAQKNVAISVAKQCLAVLDGGEAGSVVNAPLIPTELREIIAPFGDLGERMGKLLIQIVDGSVSRCDITYGGELAQIGSSTKYINAMILKGMLDPILHEPVNTINAPIVAKERGIIVTEKITEESSGYRNLISVQLTTDVGEVEIQGSVRYKGERGGHIVSICG
ncbi:MAG: phosphoglycerate dehydrogenase, partial [Euryarchaeota archaeon]|nr:phosphoglycerate dehydrogenase [Euryarchaeota archaeon]